MVNYRGIMRLGSDPESTQRCIATAIRNSRDTIREVLTAAKKAGMEWPLNDSVTNEVLRSILFPEKFAAMSLYGQSDYCYIHAELALPGVNMTRLWMEYNKLCEAGRVPNPAKFSEQRNHGTLMKLAKLLLKLTIINHLFELYLDSIISL